MQVKGWRTRRNIEMMACRSDILPFNVSMPCE
jgi:hypothetical protein